MTSFVLFEVEFFLLQSQADTNSEIELNLYSATQFDDGLLYYCIKMNISDVIKLLTDSLQNVLDMTS